MKDLVWRRTVCDITRSTISVVSISLFSCECRNMTAFAWGRPLCWRLQHSYRIFLREMLPRFVERHHSLCARLCLLKLIERNIIFFFHRIKPIRLILQRAGAFASLLSSYGHCTAFSLTLAFQLADKNLKKLHNWRYIVKKTLPSKTIMWNL